MSKLRAKTLPVHKITPLMRDRMYQVFEKYYASVSRAQFEKDLSAKEAAILLIDTRSEEIQGFSTLTTLEVPTAEGRKVRAIYSGDTVVEQAYWGQKVLGVEFLRVLFLKKFSRPFEPLYWFLISKGYKTYLLMANNFKTHYPRHEVPTPAPQQAILDAVARRMFPNAYSTSDGLIRFPQSMGQLREGVAEITERELQAHPRIRYFAEKNPEWSKGTELACLAEMTFTLPFEYGIKRLKKVTFSPFTRALQSIRPASVGVPARRVAPFSAPGATK